MAAPRHFLISAVCLALTGVLFAGAFSSWPSAEIDVEMYPSFSEASQHGWLAALTMDRAQNPAISLPYAGWPPLHGLLVCLAGKAGLSFKASVAAVNALALLLSAAAATRLLRLLQLPSAQLAAAAVVLFSAASWVTATMAFAHILTPLSLLLGISDFIVSSNASSSSRSRPLALIALAGFTCASMNWAAFFVAPAVVVASWWLRLPPDTSPAARPATFSSTLRWAAAFTLGTILFFILFKTINLAASRDPGALLAASSGNLDRFKERALPTPGKLAGAAFFTAARCTVAALVLLAAAAAARRSRSWLPASTPAPARIAALALLLAPLGFIAALSGEMAVPAHTFHSRLFIPWAALSAALWFPALSSRARTAGVALLAASSAFAVWGGRFLPESLTGSPALDWMAPGFAAPGNLPVAFSNSAFSPSAVARTLTKQAAANSLPRLASRHSDARGKIIAWLESHRDFIRSNTSPDDVILGWHHMGIVAPWALDRTVLGGPDNASVSRLAAACLKHLPPQQLVIPVPAGTEPESIAAALKLPDIRWSLSASSSDLSLFRGAKP
jgi:hypothetical protein